MRVLFMGSGSFAITILKRLYDEHLICAIYTAPFSQQSSRNPSTNQVEEFAKEKNIALHKESCITGDVVASIAAYNPDVIVVASYGFLLPSTLLNIGGLHKPINVHPSALPKWRGAAPIERSIEAGDIETAVCIMRLTEKMDAGDILLQKNIHIDNKTDAVELGKMLATIGAELLLEWLMNPCGGTPQHGQVTIAKKIKKEELFLSFSDPVMTNYNKIRAFVGHGGCRFLYNNEIIKIFKAECVIDGSVCNNQTIDIDAGTIPCADGSIRPILMQREGRKIMGASEVFRGLRR